MSSVVRLLHDVDAEECWVQLTNSLKDVPGLPGPSSESSATGKFVEQYMTGELRRVYVGYLMAMPFRTATERSF